MIWSILSERLRDYAPMNALEQENALHELLQHFVLASLWRARLFAEAAFHGGTCLRVLFGGSRFSEDLGFLLKEPCSEFRWSPYLARIGTDFESDGFSLEVRDDSKKAAAVKKAVLRVDPPSEVGAMSLPFPRHPGKKIRIKLEVDANPPLGSVFEARYITFPVTAAISVQTLESAFATKSHALLCREYVKGRDWYDFIWFVSKGVVPELTLLANAMDQQGPWEGQRVEVTTEWYLQAMRQRIDEIDWKAAREDVARFVAAREQDGLALWGRELFVQQLHRLAERMGSGAAG